MGEWVRVSTLRLSALFMMEAPFYFNCLLFVSCKCQIKPTECISEIELQSTLTSTSFFLRPPSSTHSLPPFLFFFYSRLRASKTGKLRTVTSKNVK